MARYLEGDKKYKVFFWGTIGAIAAIVLFVVFGFFVKVLWNNTIAEIFEVNAITFWQAVGIFILAKLLFGFGSGSARGFRRGSRRRHGRHAPPNPDDDDAFRQYWESEGKVAYETFLAGRDGEAGHDKT
ncbi:MAG: hypothetical protein KDI19_00725 [Pseudomonadales bacterium]|nr:hypothetical protein [Pseudomonadales bacterium]